MAKQRCPEKLSADADGCGRSGPTTDTHGRVEHKRALSIIFNAFQENVWLVSVVLLRDGHVEVEVLGPNAKVVSADVGVGDFEVLQRRCGRSEQGARGKNAVIHLDSE